MDDDETAEDLATAAATIRGGGPFWQRHYPLHPAQSRVKNWMWVHERYCVQAKALLAETTDMAKLSLQSV